MKIKVLPDVIVNQISAGEVVERPSSIVRELVENAVDAGADDISIFLEQGGHTLIRVSDNGCGMERDDALLSLERHATSKISKLEDLRSISSLGFRGEAVPAIASVSKFRIRTRTGEKEVGTEVVVQGGSVKSVTSVSLPQGTEMEVRALFFNTPVRKKFLKSPRQEELRVKQWLVGSSLSNPKIRYRFFVDGREALNLSRRESIEARARELFRGTTVSFDSTITGIQVRGIVGHPSIALADSGSFVIIVNGRVVSDRAVLRAVKEGFCSTLKDREFPVGFVKIDVDPETVDVNVHPQKSEVRFSEPSLVFCAVRDTVQEATIKFRSPVAVEAPFKQFSSGISVTSHYSQPTLGSSPVSSYGNTAILHANERSPSYTPQSSPLTRSEAPFLFSELRFIGQALQCYLFTELKGRVYVIDMHAAHERYNYNLIRKAFRERRALSQELLLPLSISVSEAGMMNFEEHSDVLSNFGFRVETFGEDTLLIRAVPSILRDKDVSFLVREVTAISPDESATGKIEEFIDHVAARIACHASIRSGEQVTKEEAYALFAALDTSEFSSACPHGRPIIVSFSETEIEQWFGRDR